MSWLTIVSMVMAVVALAASLYAHKKATDAKKSVEEAEKAVNRFFDGLKDLTADKKPPEDEEDAEEPIEETHSYHDGDKVTAFEANQIVNNKCPDCGQEDGFLAGPRGGMSQNFKCSNEECGSRFNDMGMFGIDRISDPSPDRPKCGPCDEGDHEQCERDSCPCPCPLGLRPHG